MGTDMLVDWLQKWKWHIDGMGGAPSKRCGRKRFMDYICWRNDQPNKSALTVLLLLLVIPLEYIL